MKLKRLKILSHEPQINPKTYTDFQVNPINGAIGAEVTGLDLNTTTEQIAKDLKSALDDHLFLVFREQNFTPIQLLNFSKLFGVPEKHLFWEGLDGAEEVFELKTEGSDEMAYGSVWHTDLTCNANPPSYNFLYSVETPQVGGDTVFSNMYLAYEQLSEKYREVLDNLNLKHKSHFEVDPRNRNSFEAGEDKAEIANESIHRAVVTHPGTGKKCLYANSVFTSLIEGFSIEESQPILEYLFAHSARPEFSGRVQWQKNTLCIWDNLCTQHYAVGDYKGMLRRMWRVTLKGNGR